MVCRTDCSPHGSLGRALYELEPSNKDARRKVRSQPINFSIFHEIDEQESRACSLPQQLPQGRHREYSLPGLGSTCDVRVT
jgi:hypothetical protein